MLALYATTLLVNAILLFSVQPMVSKMLLPIFGGAPAVWTTCMVFFQAALLAGYAYSHAVTSRLSPRRQIILHCAMVLLPLLVLPIAIPKIAPPGGWSPLSWLLRLLLLSTAPPFFLVATGSPLLQRWFSRTRHRWAGDPYFLYAASNIGNLLALVLYPTLIENHLTLAGQSRAWATGYAVLAVLTLACGVWSFRTLAREIPKHAEPVARTRWLRWLALAFIPSSLMLGATTYITTDIAAIPMLWLLPLTLYILSFSIAFARPPRVFIKTLEIIAPFALLTMAFFLVSSATMQLWLSVTLHLILLFVLATLLHFRLAEDRPAPESLTTFYLVISLGGVMGGAFNAVAPLIFSTILEYPLTLVAACFFLPVHADNSGNRRLAPRDYLAPGVVALAALALWWGAVSTEAKIASIFSYPLPTGLAIIFPYLGACQYLRQAAQFRLAVAAILLVHFAAGPLRSTLLHRSRGFFGVLTVFDDYGDNVRKLRHGTTFHGIQSLDPARRQEPMSYYSRLTPIGKAMKVVDARRALPEIGVVGLGTGTMAAYAKKDGPITFFEIDEAVVRIARDKSLFTYLSDAEARGAKLHIVMGDARLKLGEEATGRFDLLVIDAFSSDAIPVHLMTREAFTLYLDKLADGGILALHISNKYLDLEPVATNIAKEFHLTGTLGWSEDDNDTGTYGTTWLLFARRPSVLDPIARGSGWRRLRDESRVGVWTDDFSNLLSVLSWDVKITKPSTD